MDKNIYDLLNDIEIDLDEYEKESFSEFEEKKAMKKFQQSITKEKKSTSHKKKSYIAAASALILALGTVGILPTVASTNPFAYKIADLLGVQKNLDNYSQVINQGVTKDGITIELSEVIVDNKNKELMVSSRLTTDEKMSDIQDTELKLNSRLHINGKEINGGVSGAVKVIDDYTAEVAHLYYLDREVSGDLDIRIRYATVQGTGVKNLNQWIFEFSAAGDALAEDTTVMNINRLIVLENGGEIEIERYVTSPLAERIYYSEDGSADQYHLMIKGHDNFGNYVEFDTVTSMNSDNRQMQLVREVSKLDEHAESLTLQVYALELPEENGPITNDYEPVGEEFVVRIDN